MSKKKVKYKLQKEEFAALLIEMAPDVSADDIKGAIEKSIASQATISRYLRGEVADTGVAFKLISYFQKEKNKRNSVLA